MEEASPVNNSALIIFVRNPVPGKVKTRLIPALGVEQATQIYKLLLEHTHNTVAGLAICKFVYYADEVNQNDLWLNQNFEKRLQTGTDLGERMENAFRECFELGFEKVVIIGSDCFQLTTDIVEQAFHFLEQKDAVVGPATDGGYYLLGLRKLLPQLFYDKIWSSDSVFEDTISDLKSFHLSYDLLETLSDVDNPQDAEQFIFR